MALTELVESAGLPHATVHRLLRGLIQERMVQQVGVRSRYALGSMAVELGLAAQPHYDIRPHCRAVLMDLARNSGDTVYLVVRSGLDAVCLERYDGTYPAAALRLEVGSRRPLGQGAGGLAILASLANEEIARILDRLMGTGSFGTRELDRIRAWISETRDRGYAVVHDSYSQGKSAMGLVLDNPLSQQCAAVAVATSRKRMVASRIPRLARQIREAIYSIEQALKLVQQRR